MGGWTCSHQCGEICDLLKSSCEPGTKGCTLYGKALFADPATPSNEALKRRDERKKAEQMQEILKSAKSGI